MKRFIQALILVSSFANLCHATDSFKNNQNILKNSQEVKNTLNNLIKTRRKIIEKNKSYYIGLEKQLLKEKDLFSMVVNYFTQTFPEEENLDQKITGKQISFNTLFKNYIDSTNIAGTNLRAAYNLLIRALCKSTDSYKKLPGKIMTLIPYSKLESDELHYAKKILFPVVSGLISGIIEMKNRLFISPDLEKKYKTFINAVVYFYDTNTKGKFNSAGTVVDITSFFINNIFENGILFKKKLTSFRTALDAQIATNVEKFKKTNCFNYENSLHNNEQKVTYYAEKTYLRHILVHLLTPGIEFEEKFVSKTLYEAELLRLDKKTTKK